jgi:hypothetical protein
VGVVLGSNDNEVEGNLDMCVEFNKGRTGTDISDQFHKGGDQHSRFHGQVESVVGGSDAATKEEQESKGEGKNDELEGERNSKWGKHPRKKSER